LATSDVPEPPGDLSDTSTSTPPRVLSQELFSPEDELILFAVLQDIANELRRIKHERKKHPEETEQ